MDARSVAVVLVVQYALATLAQFADEPQGFATIGGAGFCQGVTIHGPNKQDVLSAAQVGSNCARIRIPWLVVQRHPIKADELCQTDPPETLRKRCDQIPGDGMTAAHVRRACWEAEVKGRLQFVEVDEIVYGVADPKFKLMASIGEGTSWSLPLIEEDAGGVRPLDVNIEGMGCYLNNLYVYARVVVMRYKSVIKHWQLENSLHVAALHSKHYGWRSRARDGVDHWSNKQFQDRVLQTLIAAVRDTNDETLRITTALDSDVPAQALKALGMHSQRSYEAAAAEWLPLGLDYISLSAFPCRFSGAFNGGLRCGEQVGSRVQLVRSQLDSEEDVDVVIVATGASTCRTEHQVPEAQAEGEQAAFVTAAYKAAVGKSVSGFFYVGTRAEMEPHLKLEQVEQENADAIRSMTDYGALTRHEQLKQDQKTYRALGAAIEGGAWDNIAAWHKAGADNTSNGLRMLLGPWGFKDCVGVESDADWALTRPDSTSRPAFDALKHMFMEEDPMSAELQSQTQMIQREINTRY